MAFEDHWEGSEGWARSVRLIKVGWGLYGRIRTVLGHFRSNYEIFAIFVFLGFTIIHP